MRSWMYCFSIFYAGKVKVIVVASITSVPRVVDILARSQYAEEIDHEIYLEAALTPVKSMFPATSQGGIAFHKLF